MLLDHRRAVERVAGALIEHRTLTRRSSRRDHQGRYLIVYGGVGAGFLRSAITAALDRFNELARLAHAPPIPKHHAQK